MRISCLIINIDPLKIREYLAINVLERVFLLKGFRYKMKIRFLVPCYGLVVFIRWYDGICCLLPFVQ